LSRSESSLQILRSVFAERVARNAKYSLRAFARDLDSSPGELSLVLSGKRSLTISKVRRIAPQLGLTGNTLTEFLQVRFEKKTKALTKKQISETEIATIADWRSMAILSLLSQFPDGLSLQRIVESVRCDKVLSIMALDRLKQLGWVEERAGCFVRLTDQVITSNDRVSKAIKSFHKQQLAHAAAILESDAPKDREFSAEFFAIDPKHLESFKRDLRLQTERLVETYKSSDGEMRQVFNLNVQLFAVTKGVDL
jgi:hypothetical protein